MKIFLFGGGFVPRIQTSYITRNGFIFNPCISGVFAFILDMIDPYRFITDLPIWEAELEEGQFFWGEPPKTKEEYFSNFVSYPYMKNMEYKSPGIFIPAHIISKLKNIRCNGKLILAS
jgi:hypothetical protein